MAHPCAKAGPVASRASAGILTLPSRLKLSESGTVHRSFGKAIGVPDWGPFDKGILRLGVYIRVFHECKLPSQARAAAKTDLRAMCYEPTTCRQREEDVRLHLRTLSCQVHYGGFPNLRGTLLGSLLLRSRLGGSYWGSPIFVNPYMADSG